VAERRTFQCDSCRYALDAWSDGNPYYRQHGRKRYAHHPDHAALAQCVGNDTPFLCLACNAKFKVDSAAPVTACPRCTQETIVAVWGLAGCLCPKCHRGHFVDDPQSRAIS